MTNATASMVAPVPAHLVSLVDAGPGYRPVCSCGWTGPQADTADAAEVVGAYHTAEAVGPADHLDRLMSDLLDIQDDLAAVVVWLAENWSAHLPKLSWLSAGSQDRPDWAAVTLMGYCSPGELVEAARVLGVTPVDDPDNPDRPHDKHYRQAVRRFGRVEVQVFARRDLARKHTP